VSQSSAQPSTASGLQPPDGGRGTDAVRPAAAAQVAVGLFYTRIGKDRFGTVDWR
jgi:hypothetical protein